jgi:hypothetical protein
VVDVVSEQARLEIAAVIALMAKVKEERTKAEARQSTASREAADGEDVLDDLEALINQDRELFRTKAPLLFAIINRCELSSNDE